ncbi:MAG TPA: ABC transporter permease subunit [Sedimentisphaerales bacterium]|nr:ABC transporter permease subunit [Sedimentisphaerales bacterium]
MLKTLIKKEITATVLDMRFVIAALLCVVLIPLGMYVSRKDYELRLAAYQREHQEYRQRYGKKVTWDVEAQGLRPPSILSIFASGVDPFMPDKIMTARSGLFRTVKEPIADHPHSFLFGKADFLFNVMFIVSLAALIFTFNSISGEREKGTLRLMIANAIPRNRILLSKVVGNYVALLIPFIISVLIALLILDASPYVSIASSNVWPAFLVIMGVTFLFILGMVSLGICISAFTKQSIDSIVLAFFVWVTLVLAVPKVSPMVADILYPVESANVFDSNKRMIAEDIDHELIEERETLRKKCFEEYGAPESDMHASRPRTEAGKKANAKLDQEFAPVAERYQKRLADKFRQIEQDYMRRKNVRSSIAMNLSRVSPICSYTYILCELSGTGVTEPDNFTRNAQRYQDQMKLEIYDKIIVKRDRHGATYSRVEGFDQSKAILPDMTYTYPTVTQALQASRLDILLLGLFTVLFCSLAFMRLNKYDVR